MLLRSTLFAAVGRAWFANGQGAVGGPGGVLSDVGVGLRLATSRSGRGSMLHVDVAFPLNTENGIRSPQLLVSTQKSF